MPREISIEMASANVQSVTVNWYCRCGAKLSGTMPKSLADTLLAKMAELHQGPGHGTTTAKKASRARAKQDRPKLT